MTNDSEEESKDAFYYPLQAELESASCHEMEIVMDDLKAKMGHKSRYSHAKGRMWLYEKQLRGAT